MIYVQLILNWMIDDKLDDPFWKFVKMPSLPPIGARIYIAGSEDDAIGYIDVDAIEWDEGCPEFFRVELQPWRTEGHYEREDVINDMRSIGWIHSREKHWSEVTPSDGTETAPDSGS